MGKDALENQVRFNREWTRVHQHAADNGVRILGDIPFYVARGGVDHHDHPGLFESDQSAGVPPDDWSSTGQLWDSPVYNWQSMQREGYQWWVERFRRMYQLVDAVRIDHFRGFVAYWSVPRESATAEHGVWRRGPGVKIFDAVHATLGALPLVAENLGMITPAVERLRQHLEIPGTVVLQFVFSESMINEQPRGVSTDNVVYTGTHDNDTCVGWWGHASEDERSNVDRALERAGIVEREPHWKLIQLALHHEANVCIIPAQDILGLGSAARMNVPGRLRGNWRWQLAPGMLSHDLALRLRDETHSGSR
jgi:4-alpha-glucanotransferase